MMRIALISPYTLPLKRGNSITAERIKNGLIKRGLTVELFDSSRDCCKKTAGFDPDIIHCLHGTKSNQFLSDLPDGHLKIPHLWPGQNPPPSDSRTVVS